MTKAKRRLKNISFSNEDAHMALVSTDVGGPANGVNTLVMKSAQEVSEDQFNSLVQIVMKSQGVSEEEAKETLKGFTQTKGDSMSEEMIAKSTVEALVAEQVEKAKQDALDAAKAEQEEITKGLQAEIEKFRQKEQVTKKAQFVEKAKGYEALGVTDENAEAVAEALMKMAEDETMKPVQEMLEKALNVAKAESEGMFEAKGHDVHVESDGEESGVLSAIKARKTSK